MGMAIEAPSRDRSGAHGHPSGGGHSSRTTGVVCAASAGAQPINRGIWIGIIMIKAFFSALALCALSTASLAGEGQTAPVVVESISLIASPIASHQAGNMEIKIKFGFVPPLGVVCDNQYITTKKSVDSDRSMLALLRDAKNTARTVTLWVTDDLASQGYPGRCSLKSVAIN